MGVQGFPTLKIVRPSKKPGKPSVEDYQGERSAKGIVNAVKEKVPNSVKRINDKNLDEWLQENKDSAKAILFSDKGIVSATLRALAIDFAGLVSVAQIKKSEKVAVEKYGITEFPSLILLQPGSEDPIRFDGKVEKEAMVKFLSQVAPPNPDCPPPKEKKSKAKKDTKKESKSSSKFAKASASHKSEDSSSAAASATSETVEEPIAASESPNPNLKDEETPDPVELPKEEVKPTISIIAEADALQTLCLNKQSKTCILAIHKDASSEAAQTAIASLASIHKKHPNIFPFVGVPSSNPVAGLLLSSLNLGSEEVHLIATHGKRTWYKKYTSTSFGIEAVEQWVDAIRMGEGKKEDLPEVVLAVAEMGEEKKAEEPVLVHVEEMTDEEPTVPEHNEL